MKKARVNVTLDLLTPNGYTEARLKTDITADFYEVNTTSDIYKVTVEMVKIYTPEETRRDQFYELLKILPTNDLPLDLSKVIRTSLISLYPVPDNIEIKHLKTTPGYVAYQVLDKILLFRGGLTPAWLEGQAVVKEIEYKAL